MDQLHGQWITFEDAETVAKSWAAVVVGAEVDHSIMHLQ